MNARPHKQSMSELKLRRLTEHNQRLREDLARPRMRVSEASARYGPIIFPPNSGTRISLCYSLIRYCKTTKDHLVRSYYRSSGPFMIFGLRSCDVFSGSVRVGTCRKGRGSIRTAANGLQLYRDVMRRPLYPTLVTYPSTFCLRGHRRKPGERFRSRSHLSSRKCPHTAHTLKPLTLVTPYLTFPRLSDIPNQWTILLACQHAHFHTPVVYITGNRKSIWSLESFQVHFYPLANFSLSI
jgi:guanine nucleotide-binding protein subunit gamma